MATCLRQPVFKEERYLWVYICIVAIHGCLVLSLGVYSEAKSWQKAHGRTKLFICWWPWRTTDRTCRCGQYSPPHYVSQECAFQLGPTSSSGYHLPVFQDLSFGGRHLRYNPQQFTFILYCDYFFILSYFIFKGTCRFQAKYMHRYHLFVFNAVSTCHFAQARGCFLHHNMFPWDGLTRGWWPASLGVIPT